MNLHEFQAKELFQEYGIPVPPGHAVSSVTEVISLARELGGDTWMAKAQIHAGARGKSGGVLRAYSLNQLEETVGEMLGRHLVTSQTDASGQPVNTVLIERVSEIDQEFYLGVLVDRTAQRVIFMASQAGGMDIEEIASTYPERILTVTVDPVVGLQPYQCRRIGFMLKLDSKQIAQLDQIMQALYRLFMDKDLCMIEINPLILTKEGELLALDAKINVDDNALYRQQLLREMRDPTQENAREYAAQQHGLNYVSLDGTIGCMVNGAGLAMATMDLIKLQGGEPANFLDVGGNTTAERVAEAFKLILADDKVAAILVNIFGGIVRCDLIAEGIIKAMQEVGVRTPVVVRLEGTNVERGRQLLQDSGLTIIAGESLTDAAQKVVAAAKGAS
ncbi:MAG: succinate--CoA ligase subunit beta [Gammaproteobacteria bacterium RBG_16_57_12]|nr:MAG: succinate--CoA ligase subunit beta [Gammaproteobacteria bacterium RBG_16_57_12]